LGGGKKEEGRKEVVDFQLCRKVKYLPCQRNRAVDYVTILVDAETAKTQAERKHQGGLAR
jgi:hypothetical protein